MNEGWKSTPCILAFGNDNGQGYRIRMINGVSHRAHRLAWELQYGPITEGMVLDHLCRNRACINTQHLEVVTPKVNTLRGDGPTARNLRKTHCMHGHPLSGENLLIKGNWRVCRTCQRALDHAYKAKVRGIKSPAPQEGK